MHANERGVVGNRIRAGAAIEMVANQSQKEAGLSRAGIRAANRVLTVPDQNFRELFR